MTILIDETNWQTKAICDSTDDFFAGDDADNYVELGLTLAEAEAYVAQVTIQAKKVCANCPVQSWCLNSALTNDEEFGVWGGLDRAERDAMRSRWLAGRDSDAVEPQVQKDFDLLRPNAGASSKLEARNKFARIARDKLLQMDPSWSTPRTKKEPEITRDEYLHICELILANQTASAQEIAGRQGKRGEWLNTRVRQLRNALQID